MPLAKNPNPTGITTLHLPAFRPHAALQVRNPPKNPAGARSIAQRQQPPRRGAPAALQEFVRKLPNGSHDPAGAASATTSSPPSAPKANKSPEWGHPKAPSSAATGPARTVQYQHHDKASSISAFSEGLLLPSRRNRPTAACPLYERRGKWITMGLGLTSFHKA